MGEQQLHGVSLSAIFEFLGCSGVVANIYLAERMASAEREPITGVWQSPWWGSGGQSPPEAEKVLRFGHAMETANLPYNSLYFGN